MAVRNFVLIPGAWLGTWVWSKVTPILSEKGYGVYPVTITGMGDRVHLATENVGIETAIQDVVNTIEYNGLDEVVLVGHSFAAKVAASVSDRLPDRVRMIIYLDSFPPKKTREPQASFQPDEFGKVKPGQWRINFSEAILDSIGSDVKGKDREWMLSKGTPWPIRLASDPITLSDKYDAIKCGIILCTKGSDGDYINDIIQGKWGELPGPHRVLEAGHFPMVTIPEETVDAMLSLVSELS